MATYRESMANVRTATLGDTRSGPADLPEGLMLANIRRPAGGTGELSGIIWSRQIANSRGLLETT